MGLDDGWDLQQVRRERCSAVHGWGLPVWPCAGGVGFDGVAEWV